MFIVDSQVHIWSDNTPQHAWKGQRKPHREVAFGTEELLPEMDAAGVARAILVPPSWDSKPNVLALTAAQQYPDRFAVMGLLDLRVPGIEALLAIGIGNPACSVCAAASASRRGRTSLPTDAWIGFGRRPRKLVCRLWSSCRTRRCTSYTTSPAATRSSSSQLIISG
jgi:hypothetical protein